jgi:hypothetical protein
MVRSMSISNPFMHQFGWRVDPDRRQDRGCSPCTTRKITDEEKIKYGLKEDNPMKEIIEQPDVHGTFQLKLTKENCLQLQRDGKSIDEMISIFKPAWKGKESVLKAKILYLLRGKTTVDPTNNSESDNVKQDTLSAGVAEMIRIVPDKLLSAIDTNDKLPPANEVLDKYDQHEILCRHLNNTYRIKNPAYGDSFGRTFKKYGPISALTRLSDKWNRIEALMLGAQNDVRDESLPDTLEDMACYCLMTIIEMKFR